MAHPIKIPENLQPFVEALGIEDTVKFLLEFGGAPVYIPEARTNEGSAIHDLLGPEKAVALGRVMGRGQIRVPTGKPFIAAYLAIQGVAIVEIARRLHTSDVSVRRWLTPELRMKARQAQWEAKGNPAPLRLDRSGRVPKPIAAGDLE